MSAMLTFAALLGFLGLSRRTAIAGMRLLGRGVDRFMAGEVATARARRGDLSGLHDAESERVMARRAQRAAVAAFTLWAALLIAPSLTPWPRIMYAACSVFWFFPRPERSRQS